ncbi:MAG: hypothetical protein IJS16_05005, partial [Butyrivibrio sp.]|nr:hypothetical protein [Butyrivibrio sp.]
TGKRRVGKRLALWAAHLRYGYAGEYTGPTPIPVSVKVLGNGLIKGSTVEIMFDHADGMVARDIGKGTEIRDFVVVDDKGKETEVKAEIIGEKIRLQTNLKADKIKKVRYLVAYTYSGAMIYNKANLPMGPFELDVD